jgi:hypothetical protein
LIPIGLVRLLARIRFLGPYFAWRARAAARRPTAWHLKRRRPPRWRPPDPVRRRSTFQPRLYDRSDIGGYVNYTEHFCATFTVLAHLDMLAKGPLQWRACAFSVGFLESLLDGFAPEDRSRAPSGPGSPSLPDWAAQIPYFDWLESAQQAAHDNASPHSEFLLAGFRHAEKSLLEGRSVALQSDELYVFARFIGLPKEEAELRTAEHKALRDLDPAAVAQAMTPAREAGRALGRAHRGAA